MGNPIDPLSYVTQSTQGLLNAKQCKTLETVSFLHTLVELLDERGIVKIKELDEYKRVVGQRLVQQYRRRGDGVVLQDSDCDKCTFADSTRGPRCP